MISQRAENFFQLLYGPNCGSSNDGCFQLPEYDQTYEKAVNLPPGPERTDASGPGRHARTETTK